MSHKNSIIIIFLMFPFIGIAQKCNLSIIGTIEDSITKTPLSNVNFFIEETQKGGTTDSLGIFRINDLCKDSLHIVFTSIGYESKHLQVAPFQNKNLKVYLNYHISIIDDVVITSKKQQTIQNTTSVNKEFITANAHENLSNLLASIAGVGTLKNGSSISKPIVHGLYGNRLSILNNGITQSGQQWGNDHSPEIDPLVANKISVIKGVGALEYAGANLGSVILIEPKKIKANTNLNGQAVYFLESNGLGHSLNVELQQQRPSFGWKINGTAKKSGDKSTPTYFLNNTGHSELNLAVQLEKKSSEKFYTDVYFSTFNTTLGVLRGAHIGNLTDLEEAFTRDIPFFTEENFSYQIDAPKQKVQHHLLKIHGKYFINNQKWIDITAAAQLNNRKEFDVRRSGRTTIPTLSLNQLSYFIEGKFQQEFDNGFILKTGLQTNITNNTNNPETGILPLIPDYLMYENSAYLLFVRQGEKWDIELGNRYNNVIQSVAAISTTLPRKVIRYDNIFHNYTAMGGVNYRPINNITLAYNLGFITRNPAINELYSNGLHQGVSGIEEGNIDLLSEKSIKTTFSGNVVLKKKWTIDFLTYFQNVENYILLTPQNTFRLTIRGAFPVFKYTQTNARIWGTDLGLNYKITDFLNIKMTYNFIKGRDLNNDLSLINMPSNQLVSEINYVIPKWKKFQNISLTVNNQYVFQQRDILITQDFVLPPNAYNLINLKVSTTVKTLKKSLHIFVKTDNLLNTPYRDYLNRQRYFSDEIGINIIIGCQLQF